MYTHHLHVLFWPKSKHHRSLDGTKLSHARFGCCCHMRFCTVWPLFHVKLASTASSWAINLSLHGFNSGSTWEPWGLGKPTRCCQGTTTIQRNLLACVSMVTDVRCTRMTRSLFGASVAYLPRKEWSLMCWYISFPSSLSLKNTCGLQQYLGWS